MICEITIDSAGSNLHLKHNNNIKNTSKTVSNSDKLSSLSQVSKEEKLFWESLHAAVIIQLRKKGNATVNIRCQYL